MKTDPRLVRAIVACIVVLLILVEGLWVFAYVPTQAAIRGDPSFRLYEAQQILLGRPPYGTVIAIKGPLTGLLLAAGMVSGRIFGLPDFAGGRLGLLPCTLALAPLAFALAWAALRHEPWQGRASLFLAGIGASVAVISLAPVAALTARGPEPKLLVALWGCASLWAAARRRWFVAGLAATLAALAWQPSGLFAIGVFLGALLQGGEKKSIAAGRVLLGMLVPVVPVVAYFLLTDALPAAIRQVLLYQFSFGRTAVGGNMLATMVGNAKSIRVAVAEGFDLHAWVVGFGMLGWVVWAFIAPFCRRSGSSIATAFRQPLRLPGLIAGLGLGVFSLLDFQSYRDLLPFLPFWCLGFGWIIGRLSDFGQPLLRSWKGWHLGRVTAVVIVAAAVLLGAPGRRHLTFEGVADSEEQREVTRLHEALGGAEPIQYIGCLAPLILEHKTNPMPFVMINDKHRNITDRELGDHAFLARELARLGVAAVVHPQGLFQQAEFIDALAEHYQQLEGTFSICAGRSIIAWRLKEGSP